MGECLQIGLIGVGGVGSYHLAAIEELEREGLVQLVAVADPTIERFLELHARLQAKGVHWHLDYGEMLRLERGLAAVTIATPIPLHYEMTLACIERDLFVHLEKPPAPSIQELEQLIQADTQKRVTVGFQMVVSKCAQRVKESIVRGEVGDLLEFRVCGSWPRTDSYYNRATWAGKMIWNGRAVFDGPATNALAHVIHNLMFFASNEPGKFEVPAEIQGEVYRARPIESYDVACLRGAFPAGARFTIAVAHAAQETIPFRIEVRGSKGWLRISEDGGKVEGSAIESLACSESTQELLLRNHRDFVAFATGRSARASTHLRDALGYVLATNGMLASSGRIHDIGQDSIRSYSKNGDDVGLDVAGLGSAIKDSFETGQLFSEQGLPWARPTSPISMADFHTISFADYLPAPALP